VNEDESVAIYHVMMANDTFDETAQALFALVQGAEEKYPGTPRKLYLDIEGHRNGPDGFDDDAYELQRHFIMGLLADYLSGFVIPIIAADTSHQNNNIPETLLITNDTAREQKAHEETRRP
jgi:hypothetical protein